MAEKQEFMVFRALLLFEVQRWYLTGETLPGVLLEERELHNGELP